MWRTGKQSIGGEDICKVRTNLDSVNAMIGLTALHSTLNGFLNMKI
jgi:hypothetical protein